MSENSVASHNAPDLSQLLSAANVCLLQIYQDSGRLHYISDQVKSFVGIAPDEIQFFEQLLTADSMSTWESLLRHVRSDGRLEFDFQVEHPSSGKKWLSFKGEMDLGVEEHQLLSGNQPEKLMTGSLIDVTQRKQSELLAQNMLDSIAESGQELLIFDAKSLVLIHANKAALINLGYEFDSLSNLSANQFIDGGETALFKLCEQVANRGSFESKQSLIRENGSRYELYANCILSQGSRFILMGKDTTSISRLRKLEDEIRDRYKRALIGSETDIWEWDIQVDRFSTTHAVARWLDVPAEDTVGDGQIAMKYVHPADLERVQQVINDTISGSGTDYLNEYRLLASSGKVVWIQARGKVQRDERGRPTMLSGTLSNITERKLAQRELQDQISTLGAVLNNVADGIVAVNSDGNVVNINPKAESIMRRSRDELLGSPILSHFKLRGMRLGSWASVADSTTREAEMSDGFGRLVPIEFAVSEARLVDKYLHIIVFRDIAGRKRFEREILYAKERAEYAAKAKTEFLATMSHEIRTPMNGILGMAQLLLDTGLNDEQYETARIIHSSGEALLTIINDILDYSKIDAGKLEVESELFDLRTAVSEVLEISLAKANSTHVPLLLDFPLEIAHRIYGDSGRIKQVLLNLLGNAVKFTQSGSITVSVKLVASKIPNANWQDLEISVLDTGIGIPQDKHVHLFESFRQADASTTRKYGGTGLGLAICKRLVELMGGEIGLESQDGEGARFWFRLGMPIDELACNPILSDRFECVEALIWHPDSFVSENLKQRLQRLAVGSIVVTQPEDLLQHANCTVAPNKRLVAFVADVIEPQAIAELQRQTTKIDFILLTSLGSKFRQQHQERGITHFLSLPVDDRQLIEQLHQSDGDMAPILTTRVDSINKEAFEGLKILLAEDNVVNQKVISRMLAKQGCEVDIAVNGVQAVDMSLDSQYNLIFMDLRMPEKDGIEAVMDIRQRELRNHMARIPIVAMTANAMGGDRDACIDAGMDDYVSKPVQAQTLTDVLLRWATGP